MVVLICFLADQNECLNIHDLQINIYRKDICKWAISELEW